ncbi:hypothetical protein OYC64_000842 [Pagothenia borchgrevinki]|uniref:Uncharacterized protein n=1 Tax=Pagothenia borchgrevinki TaxID=8213 RepID=A0ABD2HI23_PAGBO
MEVNVGITGQEAARLVSLSSFRRFQTLSDFKVGEIHKGKEASKSRSHIGNKREKEEGRGPTRSVCGVKCLVGGDKEKGM